MKFTFERKQENIVFRVSDFNKEYEKALQMCFYQEEGGSYTKRFSENTTNIDKIMDYYSKNAEEMFSQLIYESEVPWEDALYEFADKMEKAKIEWWLVGSCAACIRGISLEPHDVEIFIDSKDIDKLNQLFEDYIIEPIVDTNGWLTKDFGVVFLHARIDIATDPHPCLDNPIPLDCGQHARNNLEEVMWRGFKIRVPPIELLLNAYKKRERFERVELLEDFLNGKDKR